MTDDTTAGRPLEAVRKHLRDGGIPLEYAAARTLTAAGFQARQGRAYIDPRENVRREIDVIGDVAGTTATIRVSLVLECKHTEVPWIVLAENIAMEPSEVLGGMIGTERPTRILVETAETQGVMAPPFFRVDPLHGFGMAVVGRKDREAYEALAQAVSACQGLVLPGQFSWIIAWPALVIDGPLFLVSYDDEGRDLVEEVQEARLMWHGGSSIRPVPVDVVRIQQLPEYAHGAVGGLNAARERLELEWSKATS
jgi:hypothetical protein